MINGINKDFDEIFNMTKYQNKYRISSHRKPKWDYSANALYFLTIVTQGRECNLGTISKTDDGAYQIMLSDFGNIVETEWFKSFEIRDELILHAFILMPNHLHAIVEINNINMGDDGYYNYVEPHGRVALPITDLPTKILEHSHLKIKRNPSIRLPKSISSFIAGFKSAVNTKIDDYIDDQKLQMPKYNRNNHFFQPNYHDHIIRNEYEYKNIQNYIANNPLNWAKDKFHE